MAVTGQGRLGLVADRNMDSISRNLCTASRVSHFMNKVVGSANRSVLNTDRIGFIVNRIELSRSRMQ